MIKQGKEDNEPDIDQCCQQGYLAGEELIGC